MVGRLVTDPDAPWTDDGRGLLSTADYVVRSNGTIASARPAWEGFSRDLLLAFQDLATNNVALHRCANRACRLLFEDASRNHARRWCDTAGCGNRDRVRRARRRRPASGSQVGLPNLGVGEKVG